MGVLTVLGLVDIAVLNLKVLPLCLQADAAQRSIATQEPLGAEFPAEPPPPGIADADRGTLPSAPPAVAIPGGDAGPAGDAALPAPADASPATPGIPDAAIVLRDVPVEVAPKTIPLIRRQGSPRALPPLRFGTGSWELTSSSKRRLTKVTKVMRENPKLRVLFRGHADDRGDDDMNQDLSEDRAEAAAMFVIEGGIARDRVGFSGVGERFPVDSVRSDAARARNRRVEVVWR